MKLAYYPGCSLEASGKEYDLSTRAVCKHLGIELIEIPDWSCCGATAGHSTSHLLSLALPARNLALAEEMGLDVTAPCASCYQRLALTCYELKQNPRLQKEINEITGRSFQGKIKVVSILEAINYIGLEGIQNQVVKPLKGLKIAAYYGCLLVRPRNIQIDDPENPQIIEKIMQASGAEPVEWPHKTECCGASLAISNEDIATTMVSRILKAASLSGAHCLVCACPLCHFNLDMRQLKVNRLQGTNYQLPVFYFTQLLGIALGLNPNDLSLHTHFVDTTHVLKMVG
ncbi:CoB--CoM heterodisulfide reductase iron-sulfur subunit B family protein [Desulfofundulus thermocisternus]|uniref:CoB--CoM heterodisulfide reductase iron-sulfur subunit B family protein n=1 Tax=Desulfofundulus thermocisternus TaxID=42471 RepID=UPI000482AFBE|nr:CoB--CoM heterodisulfide reductase iron-sulfur subunit B family protein [Desulfofundulus thermocisternus]